MSEYLAFLGVLVFSLGWICLPLIPTLKELRERTEARPLRVERDNEGEVRSFARNFKGFLELSLQAPTLQQRLTAGAPEEGSLRDGTPYRLGRTAEDALPEPVRAAGTISGILLLATTSVLPDDLAFVDGIYAAQDVDCGQRAVVRCIYGERDVRLRTSTTISRWVHAENQLKVAGDCVLHGRASAEDVIFVGPRVLFERLHARRIVFGRDPDPVLERGPLTLLRPEQLRARQMAVGSFFVDGDLEVPQHKLLNGNYISGGTVRMGSNSQVDGSIRSYGDMHIGEGSVITGSLISSGDLEIGPNCHVRGPVIASRRLIVHSGCQIGIAGHPTSAVAPEIFMDLRVLVLGTVWAREQGQVGE